MKGPVGPYAGTYLSPGNQMIDLRDLKNRRLDGRDMVRWNVVERGARGSRPYFNEKSLDCHAAPHTTHSYINLTPKFIKKTIQL
jgi:hypothetical protein